MSAISTDKIIKFNYDNALSFLEPNVLSLRCNEVEQKVKDLYNGVGKGNDKLGWIDLPTTLTETDFSQIKNIADDLRNICEVVVVIGVGGSYLGAKAVIDALSDTFAHLNNTKPLVIFAGYSFNADYIAELQKILFKKEWGIVVISKSGTTAETSIGFRILKKDLEAKYGKDNCKNRIVAITNKHNGALKQIVDKEGYKVLHLSENIGGRYSVLSVVGLLPIAIAGFNIEQLICGAVDMAKELRQHSSIEKNISAQYAFIRNELFRKGKNIEILVNYNPKLHYFAEWWKQLFAESEGKELKGIYPTSANFTSDLHSIGQYIQQGQRIMFETVLSIKASDNKVTIPNDDNNFDELNYLTDKTLSDINGIAEQGTTKAHIDGGVPNMRLEIPELNEYFLGQLIYFFQMACAISGYLMGVNPFDQPGVEDYKKNVSDLLHRNDK